MVRKNFVLSLLLVLVLTLSFSFVLATVSVGNPSHNLTSKYSPGENMRGWINISVTNEPKDSLLVSSFGKSWNLIKLFEENNIEDNCVPLGCDTSYVSTSAAQSSKIITIAPNQEKVIGIKLTGVISDVDHVNFQISSDVVASCASQLKIDFLDDNVIDLANNKSLPTICSGLISYGCFDVSKQTEEYFLQSQYCQRIKLPEAPAFEIGAQIKVDVVGDKNVVMEIFEGTAQKASCTIPSSSLTLGEREVSCNVNFLVEDSKDYYVCTYTQGGTTGTYKLKGYISSTNACGFSGVPTSNSRSLEDSSYKIFVKGKKFDNFGTLIINDVLPSNKILSRMVEDYLDENYDMVCPTEGCIVPIKIKGVLNQQVTISNLNLKYYRTNGQVLENSDLYDISKQAAKISTTNNAYQKFNIETLNFSVPSQYGNATFTLSLAGNQLLTQEINISFIPELHDLTPLATVPILPTTFVINATSPNNKTLRDFEWDFGNGDKRLTSTKNITYTYNATGAYVIKVAVTDVTGQTGLKSYNVIVGSPGEIVNTTLNEKKDKLKNAQVEIAKFNTFQQNKIKSAVNFEDIESSIEQAQRDLNVANTEEQYTKVLNDLVKIDVPVLEQTKSGDSLAFINKEENVDFDTLSELLGEKAEDVSDTEYLNAWQGWISESIKSSDVTFKEISADGTPIVSFFEINVNFVDDYDSTSYLVIEDLDNLEFETVASKKEGRYQYVTLRKDIGRVSFSTTETVDFTNIPAFITPELRDLPVTIPHEAMCNKNKKCEKVRGEKRSNCSDCTAFWPMVWWAVGLLIFFFILYIIIQEWYKRHYENYLFKNRNYLFNVLSYIHSEKIKGIDNSKIEHNLKKSGWNSEQVRYAMKKYFGKRTGMFEIPMGWLFNRFSSKQMPRYDKNNPYGIRRY